MKIKIKKILLEGKIGLLILIFLTAFFIRVWGINYGLPFVYNFDEGKIIYTAFFSSVHLLRPDTYIHSILIAYVLIPIFGIYYLTGLLLGNFYSPLHFYSSYLNNPSMFVLLGRLMMVLISMGCVFMIYLIGKRFFNFRIAVISVFFLSLNFLIVKESHFIKDEILASLFLLIFFYFLMLAIIRKRLIYYILVGIFLGLSVSAKYIYSPVFLVLPFTALFKNVKKERVFLTFLLGIITFIITNPYTIIDFSNFFIQTRDLFLTQQKFGPTAFSKELALLSFLREHIPQATGIPLFLISCLGFIFCMTKGIRTKEFLLSLTTLLIFAGIIIGGGNFARWAVPMMPFLILMAALLLDRFIGKKKIVLVGASIILAFSGFIRIIKFDHMLVSPDTRNISKIWIERNIANGSKIVIEGASRDEIPSTLAPSLLLNKSRLLQKIRETQNRGQKAQSLQAQFMALDNKVSYDLLGVPRIDFYFDEKKGKYIQIKNVAYYKGQVLKYIINSSWANRGGGQRPKNSFTDSLLKNYVLIKEFKPDINFENDPLSLMDYQALDKISPFKKGIFGPEIRIYQLKK